MKLATLDNGTRDGALHVVDGAAAMAVAVPGIAPHLQAALDQWDEVEPLLRSTADRLCSGRCADAVPIADLRWMAPLPRAFQLLDGGGYLPHLELGYIRRKQPVPDDIGMHPMFYQSVSDSLLGPNDDILLAGDDLGVDFEAEIVIVTDDVPQGTSKHDAPRYIRLLALMNDITLRLPQRQEYQRGFGFLQAKPKKAFAPFAVTPDELGSHWRNGLLSLPVRVEWNGRRFGEPNAGEDALFDFMTLVAEASRHRKLASGTIIAGGTVSNADRSRGQCCINERRVLEAIETGEETTPFMTPGDRVRIEVFVPDGSTVFGAIDQTYRRLV